MKIEAVLEALSRQRPIFYSEADFQHAFAWTAKSLTMCEARLEVRMIHSTARASIDLLLNLPDEKVGFEFKYITKPICTTINGESFTLLNQGALDILRYNCLKDISRLENAIGSHQIDRGFFVLLTNDPALWSPPLRQGHADDEFKIHHSATLSGTRSWGPTAGPGTTNKRENTISFAEDYVCEWVPYSFIQGEKFGTFQALVIPVKTPSTSMHTPFGRQISPKPNEKTKSAGNRYSKLTAYLIDLKSDSVELTFDKIRDIVGSLPPSAYKHSAYWSRHLSQPLAKAWSAAGWHQVKLDFHRQSILLERITDPPIHSTKPPQ
ncbi:MAG: hypothetical protein ACKVQS_06365 [Fimbriimonadaceae bacterium]